MLVKFVKVSLVLGLFLVVFSSCVKYRNLVMMNETNLPTQGAVYESQSEVYKVRTKDLLDITVASTDANSIHIFSKSIGQGNINPASESGIYLKGYVVDDSGKVSIPIIGDVKVAGKTMMEVKDTLQSLLDGYFKYSTIDVKLLSFRISVLGEVASNGNFPIYREEINLLEAIAVSGGMTDFSRKDNVKIIRDIGQGKKEVMRVDFTNPNLLNHPWYYLKPNDIVYVEPLKAKRLRVNNTTISIFFSALSFTLLTINLLTRN